MFVRARVFNIEKILKFKDFQAFAYFSLASVVVELSGLL
jgi:hypothetical protein